jgi:large subunit ribosomal protein L18
MALIASGLPRFVVRPSNKHITVQVVTATPIGDRTVIAAHSSELEKFSWKAGTGNLPASYLTGMIAGYRALHASIKKAILDIGLHPSIRGSRLYAALRGAAEAGLEIPHDKEVLPEDSRINGEHIAAYARMLSTEPSKYQRTFSAYLRAKMKPEELPAHFNEVKARISEKLSKVPPA